MKHRSIVRTLKLRLIPGAGKPLFFNNQPHSAFFLNPAGVAQFRRLNNLLQLLYAEAPSSATIVLVCNSQVGLYGLLRICFSLYGLKLNAVSVGWIVVILGVL